MSAEPGVTEGPAQAPKTTTEPFTRETGDISSFAKASEHLSSLVDKPITEQRGAFSSWRAKEAGLGEKGGSDSSQFYERKSSDLSSFIEAANKSAEIVSNPELQKAIQELGEVAEKIAVQDAAVDLVEGYVNWAKTTGDARVTKLLSGNIAGIVRRFATNPDRASKTLAELTTEESPALSEEDIKAFRSKLEDEGIVSKESASPTTEPPATTAK